MNPKCPKCSHNDSREFTNSMFKTLKVYVCPRCAHSWEVYDKKEEKDVGRTS
jgi:uncharacterized Zn ribbon protein